MAVGFPTKANWAAGDVLTASAMDDLAGTVNLLSNGSAASGSALLSNAAGTSFTYSPIYAAGKNGIINGGMDIFQRSSTPTTGINTASSTQAYTLDRLWVYSNGPAVTTSQQLTGDTTNLPNIQYCARLQRQSGQTSTSSTVYNFALETKDAIRFAGQTVTVSYYARKSATYTGTSTGATLISGTGTDQSGLGGYTGQATVVTATPSITTTWVRYQMTATVATTATELRLEFAINNWAGTAGANDYIEITGVQLELGSVATTFSRTGGTIQGELAACQRYYYRILGNAGYSTLSVSSPANSATTVYLGALLPVTMRTAPTAVDYNTISISDSVTRTAISSLTLGGGFPTAYYATVTVTVASGLTQYRPYFLQENAGGTAAYLGFNAEL